VTAPASRPWDKVEFYSSYFLMVVLASVIGTRLSFASVWELPTLDLILSTVALVLVVASFWIARKRVAGAYGSSPSPPPRSCCRWCCGIRLRCFRCWVR